MALLSSKTEPIGNISLDEWEALSSGGFGHVYKARHKEWGFDVAIKIPHNSVCPLTPIEKEKTLRKEADHMKKATCEFVLMIYGHYLGCPPGGGTLMKHGIVMEFMGRGCVHSMLGKLSGPPPLPLAFRWSHQVALGMNFLHSKNIVHQDLKPNNVLLNDDLIAKVADLGLSRVSTSALNSYRHAKGERGGSYKYMPPEAFETSYEPVRAFDRYSYGILVWSIITGKEPYPAADYTLVSLKVPMGDRPPHVEFDQMKTEGLKEMVDLMKRCWEKNPSDRPTFKDCLEITEKVYSKHKKGIHDVVSQVLKRLESPTSSQNSETSVALSCPPVTPEPSQSSDVVDHPEITENGISSVQDSVSVSTTGMTATDKAKFVDDKRAELIQRVSEVMAIVEDLGDMVHSETYSVIEAEKTSQGKMRVLYQRTFRSGGVKVKAAFYDALKKHHPELV